MDDTLVDTPDATQSPTVLSDRVLRRGRDLSKITEQVHTPTRVRSSRCFVAGVGFSESNTADWITTTYPAVEIGIVPPDSELNEVFLSAAEAQFIQQIREDLAELPDLISSSPAAKSCKTFAEGVGIALVHQPKTRWAVFAEENGVVAFVAHSRASKNQVSFEFGADTSSINIVRIDADMQRDQAECKLDDVQALGCAIAWLTPN